MPLSRDLDILDLEGELVGRLAEVAFNAWCSTETLYPPYPREEASSYMKRHWRLAARAVAGAVLDELATSMVGRLRSLRGKQQHAVDRRVQ